jgi:hypothetical protein
MQVTPTISRSILLRSTNHLHPQGLTNTVIDSFVRNAVCRRTWDFVKSSHCPHTKLVLVWNRLPILVTLYACCKIT